MLLRGTKKLVDVLPALRRAPESEEIGHLSLDEVSRVRSTPIRSIKSREGIKLLRNCVRSAHFALLGNPSDSETPLHYLKIALHIIDKIEDRDFVRRVAFPRCCQWSLPVLEVVKGYEYERTALQFEEMFRAKAQQIYLVNTDFESFRHIVGYISGEALKDKPIFAWKRPSPLTVGVESAISQPIQEAFQKLRDRDYARRSEGLQSIHCRLGLNGLRLIQGHIAGLHGLEQSREQLEKSHLTLLISPSTPEGRQAAAQLTFSTDVRERVEGIQNLAVSESDEAFEIFLRAIQFPAQSKISDDELKAICKAAQDCRDRHFKFKEYEEFCVGAINNARDDSLVMRERFIRACIFLELQPEHLLNAMRDYLVEERNPAPIIKLRSAQYVAAFGDNFTWGENDNKDPQLLVRVLTDLSHDVRNNTGSLAVELIDAIGRSRLRYSMIPFILKELDTGSHESRLNLLYALDRAEPTSDFLAELLKARQRLLTDENRARGEQRKRETSPLPWKQRAAQRWEAKLCKLTDRRAVLDRTILRCIENDPRAIDRMLAERTESRHLLSQLFPFIGYLRRADLAPELNQLEATWGEAGNGKTPNPELLELRDLIRKLQS